MTTSETNDEKLRQLLADTIGPGALTDADIDSLLDDADAAPLTDAQTARLLRGAAQTTNPAHDSERTTRLPATHRKAIGGWHEPREIVMKAVPPSATSSPLRSANFPRGSVAALALSAVCLVAVLIVTARPGLPQPERLTKTRSLTEQMASVWDFSHNPAIARPMAAIRDFAQLKIGELLETGARERRRVHLPDGSVLYVNENTRARLQSRRSVVVESGEVFVEVAPAVDEQQQRELFYVRTPDRTVTALGTKFSVSASDETTDVLVTQGKVKVSGVDNIFPAGQFVRFNANRMNLAPAPRASEALNWTQDLMLAAAAVVPPSEYRGGALVSIDPNGQEMQLSLRKYHVDVHIEDGFARTTIDQTYFNHTWQRLEGTFKFPLPADASLSRLAMYVNGKLMEGGMAERQHARNTFEQIMHTKKDPALLEWVDGSTFQMRVFPLEPRQEKRIVISYSQRLATAYGKTHYRFPAGHNLDTVRDWSTQIRVRGGENLTWKSPSHKLRASRADGDLLLNASAEHALLDRDLVLEVEDDWAASGDTATHRLTRTEHEQHQYLMLRCRPQLEAELEKPKRNWAFLFETSGDRDPVLARAQIEIIRTLLKNAEHTDTFNIVTAAARPKVFSEENLPCTPRHIAAAVKHLEQAHLVGAFDLEKALTALKPLYESDGETHLVHVGGALPVLGETSEKPLAEQIPREVRYVGVGVGKRWSRQFMRAAAGRTGGYFTQINPDEKVGWRAFELLSVLNAPRLLNVSVIDQAEELRFLTYSESIAHGEELCAIARLPKDAELPDSLIVSGELDGKTWNKKIAVAQVQDRADYLPRSWARLEIDRLIADGANQHRDEIIALSKAMYVMSPFTSLLVLENEQMYAQFNIDRGRKDHWALYPCPDTIPVVHEPHDRLYAANRQAESDPADTVRFLPGNALYSWHYSEVPQLYSYFGRPATDATQIDFLARPGLTTWGIHSVDDYFGPVDYGLVDNLGSVAPNGLEDLIWLNSGVTRYERGRGLYRRGSVITRLNDGAEADFDVFRETTRSERLLKYRELRGGERAQAQVLRQLLSVPQAGGQQSGRVESRRLSMRPVEKVVTELVRRQKKAEEVSDGLNAGVDRKQARREPGIASRRARGSSDGESRPEEFGVDAQTESVMAVLAPNPESTVGFIMPQTALPIGLEQQLSVQTVEQAQRRFGTLIDLELQKGLANQSSFEALSEARASLGVAIDESLTPRFAVPGQRNTLWYDWPQFQGQPGNGGRAYFRDFSGELTGGFLPALQPVQGRRSGREGLWFERDGGFFYVPHSRANVQWDRHRMSFGEIQSGQALGQNPVVASGRFLSDLVAHAPGLNTIRADVQALLETESAQKARRGHIEPAARRLIEKARAAGWERIRFDDGPAAAEILCDGQGRLLSKRRISEGLIEHIVCDGRTLWHAYPEIGLAGRREYSRFHRAAFAELLPWLVAPADELAIGANVTAIGANIVAVTPLKPNTKSEEQDARVLRVHLIFGSDGRLQERQLVDTESGDTLLRVVIADEGSVTVYDQNNTRLSQIRLRRSTATAPDLNPPVDGLVVLSLPHRSSDHVFRRSGRDPQQFVNNAGSYSDWTEADALALLVADTLDGQWLRAAHVMRTRFLNKGDRRSGLFVLMIRCSHAWNGQAGLQPSGKEPALVRFARHLAVGSVTAEFDAESLESDFLRTLADARNTYYRWAHGLATKDRTKSQIRTELRRALAVVGEVRSPAIGWSILRVIQPHLSYDEFHAEFATAAKRFQDSPELGWIVRHERSRALFAAGKTGQAARLYARLLTATLREGLVPPIEKPIRDAFVEHRGQRAWSELCRSIADELLNYELLRTALLFSEQLQSLGDIDLAENIFERAMKKLEPLERPDVAIVAIRRMAAAGRKAEADRLLSAVMDHEWLRDSARLWRFGAALAEEAGQKQKALSRLERAISIEFRNRPEVINLQTVRQTYSDLLRRLEETADAAITLDQDFPPDLAQRVMRAADQWRAMEDDETQACQTAARILTKLGHTQLSWDYVTTPLATQKGSAAWASLGRTLGQQGQLELAELAYHRAFEFEQTNPQILFEHAELMKSGGKPEEARELLKRIATGTWQPRFNALRAKAQAELQ